MKQLLLTLSAVLLISPISLGQVHIRTDGQSTRGFQHPYSRLTQLPFDSGRRRSTPTTRQPIKSGVHVSTSTAGGGVHVATGSGTRRTQQTQIRTRNYPIGYRGFNRFGVPFIVTRNGIVLLGSRNGGQVRPIVTPIGSPQPTNTNTTPSPPNTDTAKTRSVPTKSKKVVQPLVLEPMKNNLWQDFVEQSASTEQKTTEAEKGDEEVPRDVIILTSD